ncbi:UNVERIFIED_CONTAM: hypothetical protein FKN15_075494 [Acipenser sinensis]
MCHQPTASFHSAGLSCTHLRATAQARRCPASLQGSLVRGEPRTPWLTYALPTRATLDQLYAAPWELSSTDGSGIDWTRTGNSDCGV